MNENSECCHPPLLALSPPLALPRRSFGQLHSVAAYYPEQPTAGEMAAARDLVAAIATLYPCAHCRERLAVDLASLPVQPALQSRTALCAWVCAQHNLVNEALGARARGSVALGDGREGPGLSKWYKQTLVFYLLRLLLLLLLSLNLRR